MQSIIVDDYYKMSDDNKEVDEIINLIHNATDQNQIIEGVLANNFEIQQLEQLFAEHKEQTTEIKSKIDQLESKIDRMESKIDHIETMISQMANLHLHEHPK